MIIASRNLHRISTFSLVAVLIFLGGCRFLSTEPTRPTYTRVATLGPLDFGEPFGIAIKDGLAYVSDGGAGTIRRIDADGNAKTIASGLNTPSAIAFLPSGELIVADTGSHTIRKISDDGSVSILAGIEGSIGSNDGPASAATFNGPVGLAVGEDGTIYVSDTYNDRIRVIRDGVVTTIVGGTRGFADGVGASASFDTPIGISVWGDKVLVADSGNARIRVVEKTGVVSTLAGGDERDLRDGSLASARFVDPTAITVDDFGSIFVADGNAIRVIGRRVIPVVETIAGDRSGYLNGDARTSRFNRPSSLAIGRDRELYVADSDNRIVRIISDDKNEKAEASEPSPDPLPLATRWPFDPPSTPREIAGTLGEIRGDLKPDGKPVWFHNGLDIAGAYGETAKFIRDETVLDPHAAENFGTSRELLRLPLIGYIHLRLGRDKDDRLFGDPRFQSETDAGGKLIALRVPRGARFAAGDAIGTLNAMNHLHLIAGRNGHEINALAALQLPGVSDSIAPVIEDVTLYDSSGSLLTPPAVSDKIRIVVDAYDRMDGNSERRRLGVYRVGYQLFSNGSPLGDTEWRIRFERSPSNESVRIAYAEGSRSGYTPDTIFNYIATNRVDGDDAREDFWDTTTLAPGRYTLRVFVADYFGNVTSKDVEITK
jgi:sugar lactone lactonase YvrE